TAVNLLPGSVKLSGCNGTIVVSVPNTLAGECTTNLGNLCTTTVSNLVPGLVNALSCLVKNALNDSPASTVSKLLCDLTNLLDVGAGVPNTALDTIVDGIKKALLRGPVTIVLRTVSRRRRCSSKFGTKRITSSGIRNKNHT
ncbi:hypothetical protein V5799_021245, partial [Amblyomma americanum]